MIFAYSISSTILLLGEYIMSYKSFVAKTALMVVLWTATGNAQGLNLLDNPQSGFLSEPSDTQDSVASGGGVSRDNQAAISSVSNNKKLRRFKVSPYASATATYSDNIGLVSDNASNKESGMIYGAGVGVNAAYQSKKLDAVAGANVTQAWRGNDTSQTLPTANAGVSAELLSNLLYLDALGAIQALRENQGTVNSFSGAGNGNYETYMTGSISPYLRHQFGRLAVGELRYGYDYGGGTTDAMGTVQSHTYKASLGTANNSARLNLNASSGYTDIGFEDQFGRSNDTTQLTNEVTATYALTRKLSAIGQIGHDNVEVSDDTIYSKELSGMFYNGGLEYRPNDRLRMTGRYGKRHNTQYYALDGNYNLTKKTYVGATAMTQLLTAVPLGYRGNITAGTLFNGVKEGETLASLMQEQMNLPGSSQSLQANQAIYANTQNTQMYISRGLNGYLGTKLSQGSAGVALGYETRDYNTAGEETITTATANYRHDFNQKFSTTLEGFYYAIESANNDAVLNTGDTYGLRLLGNYALNKTVNLFAAVGRTQRSAERPDAEFTEHNITAGVSTQF